ncbi:MAG: RNA polymerase sigma factor [Candidatus Limnocylindrales bacterium]
MDTDLVLRAQQGDRSAFAQIVDEVLDRFLAIAHRILRDGGLAEDATQAALLGMWRDLPGLRQPERFGAWSTRLLVNACYSEARRARRWLPNLSLDSAPEPRAPDELEPVLDRDELERAFRDLPVEQRAAIVLHHYVGMPVESVAQALDIPAGTVRSRIHRGMNTVRGTMRAERLACDTLLRQEATR